MQPQWPHVIMRPRQNHASLDGVFVYDIARDALGRGPLQRDFNKQG